MVHATDLVVPIDSSPLNIVIIKGERGNYENNEGGESSTYNLKVVMTAWEYMKLMMTPYFKR